MYSYLYSKINRNKNEISQLNSTHFFILYAPNQFQIFPKLFPKIFTQLPVHITTKFLTQNLLTLSYHNQNPIYNNSYPKLSPNIIQIYPHIYLFGLVLITKTKYYPYLYPVILTYTQNHINTHWLSYLFPIYLILNCLYRYINAHIN